MLGYGEGIMTRKDVKYALQRGLGRGYLAVKADPEKYRDLVKWACERDLSFDTQSEGTRAWYDYQLIMCYSDRTEFRDTIVKRFHDKKPDSSWDYAHFSELLSFFAEDGDQIAQAALWKKYEELLAALHGFRRSSRRMMVTTDCFEYLCVALCWTEENYARIAADIGDLFMRNHLYDGWHFEWIYDSRPNGVNQRLIKKAAHSKELSAYLSAIDGHKSEFLQMRKTRREAPIPDSGRPLSVYLKRKAPELAPSYAEKYLAATDPEARATALEAFAVCPYPLDPASILADAQSDYPDLRDAAMEALAMIRHPAVRSFAWAQMDINPEEALPIGIKNYLPEDEGHLYAAVRAYPVDYACKSGWHHMHMMIQDLFDRDSGVDAPPKSLLPLLYESTLCSFCRGTIYRLMGRYHMTTPAMWEEMLYDSNDDIRAYAAAHFRRIKSVGPSGM